VVPLMLSAAPHLSVDEIRGGLEATARRAAHMDASPERYGAGVGRAHAAVPWAAHSGSVTGTVHGRVAPVDGNPTAATATVAGISSVADPETGHSTLRVPAGAWQLRADRYGYRPRSHAITVATGQALTLNLLLDPAPVRSVTGTVTGPDGPVADARVVVADA